MYLQQQTICDRIQFAEFVIADKFPGDHVPLLGDAVFSDVHKYSVMVGDNRKNQHENIGEPVILDHMADLEHVQQPQNHNCTNV
jgi:hypothetical protein